MTDKILKEAFDKMVAIEEGEHGKDVKCQNCGTVNTADEIWNSGTECKACGSDVSDADYDDERHTERHPRALDEADSPEDARDGIEEFQEIQSELFELIDRLTDAIRAYTPESLSYWQSYGLAQLKIIAGSDEYASTDRSINSLIKGLEDDLQSTASDYEMEDATGTDNTERFAQMRQQLDTIKNRVNGNEPSGARTNRTSRVASRRRGTGSFDKSMTQR